MAAASSSDDGDGEQQGKATANGMAMVVLIAKLAKVCPRARGDRSIPAPPWRKLHRPAATVPPLAPHSVVRVAGNTARLVVAIGMVEIGLRVFDPIGRNYETEFTSYPQPCGRLRLEG